MKLFDPTQMKGGWYIGNFEPSAFKTAAFEVSVMQHTQGEFWPLHYHEQCDEINYLLEGKMLMHDTLLEAPAIFVLERGEIANPEFLTDCKLVVVKTPSVPGDKIIVNKETTK